MDPLLCRGTGYEKAHYVMQFDREPYCCVYCLQTVYLEVHKGYQVWVQRYLIEEEPV